MVHSSSQGEGNRINGKRPGITQPSGVVFEGRGRPPFGGAQPPHKKRLPEPINVHLDCHRDVRRMRLAVRSSSRSRPMVSSDGLARPTSRSCSCRMNVAVASVPMLTLGSPFSRRHKVPLLTKSLSAMSWVEMPRFLRARERSRPSLRRACRAGSGRFAP
jgi:hypothetical protein